MQRFADALLDWFYENRRLLPFRQEPTPYHIWISEIMLQQTRMTAAVPYYERFIAELPDPAALAACDPDRLRKLWQGLGYYSRAANLQKAARVICEQYGGELPADYDALRALPGIGDYTAGAIASIGFGIPAPAVDGNVLRVFARLYDDDADVTRPETKRLFTRRVCEQQPQDKPGDFNQALMELGALVCLPNGAPQCGVCPLADVCQGRASGRAQSLPVKPAKKPRPELPLTVAVVQSPRGVLLQKRPDKGLLAKLWRPFCWTDACLPTKSAPCWMEWDCLSAVFRPWGRQSMYSPTKSGRWRAGWRRRMPPPPCRKAASGPCPKNWLPGTPSPALLRPTCPPWRARQRTAPSKGHDLRGLSYKSSNHTI